MSVRPHLTVAVVDVAIDTRHPEFAGRVVPGRDVATGSTSTLPSGWQPHGTEVAGLVLAAGIHVRGMAPAARLMGVRVPALATHVGDPSQSEGILWAAQNGADVICCAWGPPCPSPETAHLPSHARAAFEWALTYGRGGKGCVFAFSSGNDGSNLNLNGYASHPGVIAVGACNRRHRRPSYSGWGDALCCVVPSNDPRDTDSAGATYTTTTPIGSLLLGETFYTTRFGFTSAACAIAAGVCARMLSINPELEWREVRQLLAASCTRIDDRGGEYDEQGHSLYYGFGCVDPERAVRLAEQKIQPASV